MTGAVEHPIIEERFGFFRASRYGYFAISVSQTDVPTSLRFTTLSQRLKTKFRNAGVRATEQARSVEDAELLYLQIPRAARLSEDLVSRFLRNKDASHIKNHGGNQVLRKDGFNPLNAAENLIWEDARVNRRRGGRDMTDLELLTARKTLHTEGSTVLLTNALLAGVQSAYISASLEMPLVALEDYVARQGRVSLTTVAKATLKAGLTGGLSGSVLHVLLACVPETTLESEIFKTSLVVLGSLGVACYVWEVALQIRKAYGVKKALTDEAQLVTIVF